MGHPTPLIGFTFVLLYYNILLIILLFLTTFQIFKKLLCKFFTNLLPEKGSNIGAIGKVYEMEINGLKITYKKNCLKMIGFEFQTVINLPVINQTTDLQ